MLKETKTHLIDPETNKKITKKKAIEELSATLGISLDVKDIKLIQHLKDKGIDLSTIKQMLATPQIAEDVRRINKKKGKVKIGIIGDTHLGAKAHDKKALYEFYAACVEQGVDAILHGGDIVDGHGVYKGQIFEQNKIGFEDQIASVINDYPRTNIDTYFINGNHDESFLKSANIDIGPYIEQQRPDLKYLGFYNAQVEINNIKIELQHGGGGGSYALSYKIQKYIEKTDPRNLPDVYILGHYHQALYAIYRNVHSFLPGSFTRENNLSRRFALGNTVGGWIVEFEKKKSSISCNPSFISF